MALAKNKWGSLLLAFALIAAMFVPQMAFAEEAEEAETAGFGPVYSLTIQKHEVEPGESGGEEGTGGPGQNAPGKPVAGVKYTLKQTHSYNPADDKWEELKRPVKDLTAVTGKDGKVTLTSWNGLKLGRYEVTETDGPNHILLNPEPFYVDIPMTNKEGTALNYKVHVYPKNETIRGSAELLKVGEDGQPLAGVTFSLFKSDGTELQTGLVTGTEGKVSLTGLNAGKYYFKETAVPAGIALNETKIEFEVKRSGTGKTVAVDWTPVDGFVSDGTVTNYNSPEITKDVEGESNLIIDRDKLFNYNLTIKAPKDLDKYASISVTDELDGRLEYGGTWDAQGTGKSNIEFSKTGQELKWTVKDPSKLTPGQNIKITFSAKIKPDAVLIGEETGIPNTADLTFDNKRGWKGTVKPADPPTVTPADGGLQVIKVDAADQKRLAGAVFKLTDTKGKVINSAAMGGGVKVNDQPFTGPLENLTTNEDGEIIITGLKPGEYRLHETKAPTYTDQDGNLKPYRLLTKPEKVIIKHGETAEITVENSKSGWLLPTTGGIGTILFTSGGLALMGLATGMYVRRRKTDSGTA
ncbi:SpaA isopeptide-forming pilin-related protein [Bhargavaea cecembensis]|uniref:SpaA isopeptide-forming pilin-related protein n=1 Tax=Bhargavaea cecembensis TaxID=394098 RepID=UPI000694EDF1|nr:SpaA isopeptide-forming pilin-related protein [Bhargavaea cecembensis]